MQFKRGDLCIIQDTEGLECEEMHIGDIVRVIGAYPEGYYKYEAGLITGLYRSTRGFRKDQLSPLTLSSMVRLIVGEVHHDA